MWCTYITLSSRMYDIVSYRIVLHCIESYCIGNILLSPVSATTVITRGGDAH